MVPLHCGRVVCRRFEDPGLPISLDKDFNHSGSVRWSTSFVILFVFVQIGKNLRKYLQGIYYITIYKNSLSHFMNQGVYQRSKE
jgi:hypothetical protein